MSETLTINSEIRLAEAKRKLEQLWRENKFYQTCTICREYKDLQDFPIARGCKNGRRKYCKACKSDIDRKRYEKNAESEREKARQRYRDNREYRIEMSRQWKLKNWEHVLEYSRQRYKLNPDRHYKHTQRWSRANPEAKREIDRRWMMANPEKAAARCQRRRALKHGNGPCITASEYAEWVESELKVCFYCGIDCSCDFQVDHIQPLSKGGAHQTANLAIACPHCNRRKSNKDPEQFIREILSSEGAVYEQA